MKRKPARLLPLLALLAGCAKGVPVERQVVVPGDHFEAVRGEADLVVRSFTGSRQERLELIGATCDVTTSLWSTRLVTPSRLVVPNFGPQSPDIDIVCLAGDRTGAARASIVTRWEEAPGYWSVGVGAWNYTPGLSYGAGWGWPLAAYTISDYPDIAVTLE